MSDTRDHRASRRGRWAVTLVLLGLVVAFVPGLAADERFVCSHIDLDDFNDFIPDVAGATFTFAGPIGAGTHLGFRSTNVVLVRDLPPTSLLDLVQTDPSWAVSVATLLIAPLLFLWWRRQAIGFGRVAGIACGMAASAAVCALVLTRPDREFISLGWIWRTVPLGGALMAAAFVVAPAPRVRDE